jgi:hypothetical protein
LQIAKEIAIMYTLTYLSVRIRIRIRTGDASFLVMIDDALEGVSCQYEEAYEYERKFSNYIQSTIPSIDFDTKSDTFRDSNATWSLFS